MMKKTMRLLCILLGAVLLLSACTLKKQNTEPKPTEPNTQESTEPVQAEDAYDDILQNIVSVLSGEQEEFSELARIEGVVENMHYRGVRQALLQIGYLIEDISGDGIPELLIGESAADDTAFHNIIYGVYTLTSGEPVRVFEGWARSQYVYMGDGKFYHYGSSGAANSEFGFYTLSQDGTALVCTDCYFTALVDETQDEIAFYHNTTGENDPNKAEKLDQTEDLLRQIESTVTDSSEVLPFTPFASYVAPDGTTTEVPDAVTISWADDMSDDDMFDEFSVPGTEAQTSLLLTATEPVTDFHVLALTAKADEDTFSYETKELYDKESLIPQRPLLVKTTFYGDLPSLGIAYIDASGEEKQYAIEVSGEDGSLLLQAF